MCHSNIIHNVLSAFFIRRYVEYFAGLLSHNIKINSAPLYLTHVTVLGAPSFQNGGCRAFLKLYEGQTPIYTSGKETRQGREWRLFYIFAPRIPHKISEFTWAAVKGKSAEKWDINFWVSGDLWIFYYICQDLCWKYFESYINTVFFMNCRCL